jgi:hypothetical protein
MANAFRELCPVRGPVTAVLAADSGDCSGPPRSAGSVWWVGPWNGLAWPVERSS